MFIVGALADIVVYFDCAFMHVEIICPPVQWKPGYFDNLEGTILCSGQQCLVM